MSSLSTVRNRAGRLESFMVHPLIFISNVTALVARFDDLALLAVNDYPSS